MLTTYMLNTNNKNETNIYPRIWLLWSGKCFKLEEIISLWGSQSSQALLRNYHNCTENKGVFITELFIWLASLSSLIQELVYFIQCLPPSSWKMEKWTTMLKDFAWLDVKLEGRFLLHRTRKPKEANDVIFEKAWIAIVVCPHICNARSICKRS